VTLAEALNNLAWLLSTCPEIELREPKRAVEYARRAVELAPQTGNYWNTLGVAYYRNGDWTRAEDALHQSIERGDHGGSFDWFFLALIDHKRGRDNEARAWYDQAVTWARQHAPNRELHRFQVEAADALRLPAPAPFPTAEGVPVNERVGIFSLRKPGRAFGAQPVPPQRSQ
jgi:tetratricopeptide (TPR) repeat protein